MISVKKLFVIGVVLFILFPKGGIKLEGIPITWGYLYLGIILIFSFLLFLLKKKPTVNKNIFITYSLTLIFPIYFVVSVVLCGFDGFIGNLISYSFNFFVLPLVFFILINSYVNKLDKEFVVKVLWNCVVIVSVFGILSFISAMLYEKYLVIPYLTTNIEDVGRLEYGKYNRRGSIFKLISTFNNGNIYGLCILMLLPLLEKFKRSKLGYLLIVISLVLTLSRTVWLGLILFYIIRFRKNIIKLISIYFILIFALVLMSTFLIVNNYIYSSSTDFLFDANLGGRFLQLEEFDKITLISSKPFYVIQEIVYLSVLDQFGIIGLILWCTSFFYPIFWVLKCRNKMTSFSKQLFLGLIVYLFCSISDGALNLIPVLVYFYFISALAICPNNMFKVSQVNKVE